MTFDPNSAASEDSGIFGLPSSEKEAALVYLPVPWEATTSYGGGTSKGPAAILEASKQVDLFDFDVDKPYEAGLFMRSEDRAVVSWNREAKAAAQKIIRAGGDAGTNKALLAARRKVNALSDKLNAWVYEQTRGLLDAGKIVGLVGGDHSTPYGAIKAAAERRPGLGLLHFDAHHDLRDAYEGFTHSHASIFHNVMSDVPQVARLVQVGIRDFCEQEVGFLGSLGKRARVFYDGDLARRRFAGETWDKLCGEIVDALPHDVWITFDIDGLDPVFCPHTGTPVPGGLSFNEAVHLIAAVARSGRRIAGFDLNEVSPGKDEWDANVGARLLYKMTGWTLVSRGLAKARRS